MDERRTHDVEALLERLRAGDQEAASAIVRQYGETVRQAIERVLRCRTSRPVDSGSDVWQTTLWDFLRSAVEDRYAGLTDDELRRLLVDMARKRAMDQIRRERAACRDRRRVVQAPVESLRLTANACRREVSPEDLEARRRFEQAVARLSPDDRELVQARVQRRPWKVLAQERGTTPDALRMKFRRILERLREELLRRSREDVEA